jgi:hypothetical protein
VSASAHARYRNELTLLADDAPVIQALDLETGWRRTYARFFPDGEPFAVLTFERAGRMLRVDVFHGLRFEATEVVAPAGDEIVRYHPGRRCTVKRGDRFGKIGVGPEVLTAQQLLWAHRHELGFAVAEPLGYEDGTLWLGAVPGEPAPLALAQQMGAALATLARSSLRPPGRPPPDTAAEELIRRVPALRDEVQALLVDIVPGPPRPIHGAPHPPQWLYDGDRLGLIDFDKLALGDPESDVATFMEAAGEAGAAFREGYDGPLDEQRLTAYRNRRRIAKALRAARAVRPDGDEKAARRLRKGAGAP